MDHERIKQPASRLWQRRADAPGGGIHRPMDEYYGALAHHDHPRRSGAGDPRVGPRWVHSRQRSRQARPAAATAPAAPAAPAAAAAPARGSTKREDKDSLTVGSRTAVRRLARRREDKDSPTFLIFPHSTTPPRRLPRLRRPAAPAAAPTAAAAGGGRGAPCPPSRRSSIRRLNALPDGRGWSRGPYSSRRTDSQRAH